MTTAAHHARPARHIRPAWAEKPRPVTQAGKAVAIAVLLVLVLMPFLVIVSTSLASNQEVVDNGGWVLWPSHPTTQPTGRSSTAASSPRRSG